MFGNLGKCPHCKRTISRATVEVIDVSSDAASYKGVSYSCSSCHAVLSVAMDPIALNADIVDRLVKALRKG